MPPPQARKRVGAPTPPPDATHWTLVRVIVADGKTKQKRCTGEPDADGNVPDTWNVSDFSPSNVLGQWGEGKFRVEWYGGDQTRLGGELFEVARPGGKGASKLRGPKRRRELVDVDDEPEIAEASGAGGGMGFMQIMALLDRNTERAERREEQKAERDRAFFMQMQQTQTSLLTAIMGRPASPLGAESLQVLEQRLGLQIDQAMFRLEQKLSTQPAADPDDDDDDPDEPPADIGEAAERMVMSWLGKVEQNPELMAEFLPKIMSFLKGQGVQPSDALQARIDAARAAANGRAHA
jgi:hypothetical protein